MTTSESNSNGNGSTSSSSSESDDDSTNSDSNLTASKWNHQRALRPVRPRPAAEEVKVGEKNDHDRSFAHLVRKRRYSTPIFDADGSSGEDVESRGSIEAGEQSDLERAVLMDCLSTHFLWSHLPKSELERLCHDFEKCSYRDHEIIYSEGDDARYCYIVYSGEVARRRGEATLEEGDSSSSSSSNEKYVVLGELAMLTGSSHQETARAASINCNLFRLGRIPFHRALRPIPEIDAEERAHLLKKVIPDEMMMDDYFTQADLKDLASMMTIHTFKARDVLAKKEDRLGSLVIIAKGSVVAKNVSLGGRGYEDQIFGPDAPCLSFGWQSLLSSSNKQQPNFKGKMVAQSDGVALMLSKSSFRKVMKGHHDNSSRMLDQMAANRLARIELQQIPIFQDSMLDETQISSLLDLMHRCEYLPKKEETEMIFNAGQKVDAALYFVREGAVTLEANKGEDCSTIESGNYFGEANMLRDQNKDGRKHFVIRSPMTAIAHGPRTVVDVLYLEECRAVIDTTLLGLGNAIGSKESDSRSLIQWADIKRYSLLGTGTFGQVWLASIPRTSEAIDVGKEEDDGTNESNGDEPERLVVALKVQSKYQVIQSGEALHVVAERNILSSLESPFLLQLFHSFQDESLLYMITSVAQGGELESLIPDDGMCESSAKFYAAGILEGLAYMHRRHLIHRDIKPQNVLINQKGYPILIDFGFAKYVPDKTFTFVGSPIFTAPEIIRFQGYDRGADNWAWAVLVYRLVTGKYPFYEDGIDELQLYKRICKGIIELDGQMTVEFRLLIASVLYPNPAQRLGSGRSGWREIFDSPWFTHDESLDARRLRMQKVAAPWVPDLTDSLDASSFHPRDESEMEDLLRSTFPAVAQKHQQTFASFGPQIE